MKRIVLSLSILLAIAGCNNRESLKKSAEELCKHIPDIEDVGKSEGFLTERFYASVNEMVSLQDFSPVLHEWEFWFNAADGSAISGDSCQVEELEIIDDSHVKALIKVTPSDDGYEEEEHTLLMEKAGDRWLIADFDDALESSERYIDNYRKEEAVRDAIADYLVSEIGKDYRQGQICIPVTTIVASEEISPSEARLWGDFWVFWYNLEGDTLSTVSGGNHSGCMTLENQDGKLKVTSFEQTEDGAGNDPSARHIFGSHYDVYRNINSNQDVREACRKDAIRYYCRRNGIQARCYQDYGWPPVELQDE